MSFAYSDDFGRPAVTAAPGPDVAVQINALRQQIRYTQLALAVVSLAAVVAFALLFWMITRTMVL